MAASKLSRGASAILDARVDSIFDRLLARLLGHAFSGKRLFVSIHPGELTLPSLFEHATTQEGGYIDRDMLLGLVDVAKDYLDKGRAEAKAITKRRIQGLLTDVDHGRLAPENFRNAVESELIDTWDRVRSNVERVVDTESQHAVSIGTKSAIDQLNTNLGIEDPTVAWLPVKDASLCDECRETHLLSDGMTPRAWKSSEVSSEYHVRGEDRPSWHNMHPHCRCALVSIFPGFGFDGAGRVTYIREGWSEYDYQRGGGSGGVDARRNHKA
jgi:hypothetical protein